MKKLLFALFMLAGVITTSACTSDDDSCEAQCEDCTGVLGQLLDCDEACSAARDEAATNGCQAEYNALDACILAEADICAMDICTAEKDAFDACNGTTS